MCVCVRACLSVLCSVQSDYLLVKLGLILCSSLLSVLLQESLCFEHFSCPLRTSLCFRVVVVICGVTILSWSVFLYLSVFHLLFRLRLRLVSIGPLVFNRRLLSKNRRESQREKDSRFKGMETSVTRLSSREKNV